jgi:hypothetical protein
MTPSHEQDVGEDKGARASGDKFFWPRYAATNPSRALALK